MEKINTVQDKINRQAEDKWNTMLLETALLIKKHPILSQLLIKEGVRDKALIGHPYNQAYAPIILGEDCATLRQSSDTLTTNLKEIKDTYIKHFAVEITEDLFKKVEDITNFLIEQ